MSGSGLESLSLSPTSFQWLQCGNFRLTPASVKSDLNGKCFLDRKIQTHFWRVKRMRSIRTRSQKYHKQWISLLCSSGVSMKTAQCILEWRGLASVPDSLASIKQNMFLPLYIFMNTWTTTVNTVHIGRYQTWKYISGGREAFILGVQCPAGTVTYLFFSIQWPLIPVTTEAAKLPMGSSMPVFICFVCWAVWNWTLPVCEEVGRGESKPSGDSALSVCACMFCVCLSMWHWLWGPWYSANTQQCLWAYIQVPCSFFFLHNMKSGICMAVCFKGCPSDGLQLIQYSGVHFG